MNRFLIPILRGALGLILAATLTGPAAAQSADLTRPITLPAKSLTRQQTIETIEKQTGYKVAFNRRSFDEKATVGFGRTEIPLREALEKLLAGSGHGYTVDGNYIIIFREAAAPVQSQVTATATRTVTGIVLDSETGNPLEGITVELMDQPGKRTTTFVNGRFQLEGIPSGNHIARLTSADGKTVRYREIAVRPGGNADVTLQMTGELLHAAEVETPSAEGEKTTAYFQPAPVDPTIRAFSDEPKSEYNLVPSLSIDKPYRPKVGIKTNAIWLATTTPNLAVEFALAERWTLDISAVYNPFYYGRERMTRFGLIQPEARYWFCSRFEKHFIGVHGVYGRFNIGNVDVHFTDVFNEHRYKGWGAGAGVSYGYHLPMGKRWGWEFTLGVGYLYLDYDKYRCESCDEFLGKQTKHYFGPTKAGISLIFMIK